MAIQSHDSHFRDLFSASNFRAYKPYLQLVLFAGCVTIAIAQIHLQIQKQIQMLEEMEMELESLRASKSVNK